MLENIKYCTGAEFYDQAHLQESLWKIWKDIFQDSDEYIDLFFKDKYRSDRVYLACQDDKIASCVHSVPYKFNLLGHVVKSSYTTAGATLPEYRGQGVYFELFDYCLNQMANQNITLTTLIVQDDYLFDYYDKLGYSSIFRKSYTDLHPSNIDVKIEAFDIDQVYAYYKSHLLSESFISIQSKGDLITILKFLSLYDGVIFVAYDSNKNIVAIAFVSQDGEKILVQELICDNETAKKNIINQICSKYGVDAVTISSSSTDMYSKAYGMARVLRLREFLDIYATKYNTLNLTISVTDSIISANSGTYTIRNGNCSYSEDINEPISINKVMPLLVYEIDSQCGIKINPAISLMLE